MKDYRLLLKTFIFQVEQMRMAQIRLDELKNGSPSETNEAQDHIRDMKKQLELLIDQELTEFKIDFAKAVPTPDIDVKKLKQEVRIEMVNVFNTEVTELMKRILKSAQVQP